MSHDYYKCSDAMQHTATDCKTRYHILQHTAAPLTGPSRVSHDYQELWCSVLPCVT